MSNTPYNVLVLMTDQQRALQHFPTAWTQKYLTNLMELQNSGITLNNGITNSCRCSPVRGMLWTSTYPPRNGVVLVGGTLTPNIATMGYILAYGSSASFPAPPASGENIIEPGPYFGVGFNGKWHLEQSFGALSRNPNALNAQNADARNDQNKTMEQSYGMSGWDSPDAGNALGGANGGINAMGGGPNSTNVRWQNDIRYAADVVDYINNYNGIDNFCLVASLVNPHDVWSLLPDYVYGGDTTIQQVFPDFFYYVIDPTSTPPPSASPENQQFFAELMTAFSSTTSPLSEWLVTGNYQDNLDEKPSVHTAIRNAFNHIYTTPNYNEQTAEGYAINYLRFYAYLTYLSDQLHGKIYTALKKHPQNLLENTIVVRLADHGDAGCSHMGMVEKDCNMYNETINVPIIFSNPVLWPTAVESDGMMGIVDVLPTIMKFAGLNPTDALYQNVANPNAPNAGELVSMFQGQSWHSYLLDSQSQSPPSNVQLFTYDDGYGGQSGTNQWHIRGIVVAPGTYKISSEEDGKTTTTSIALTNFYKYAVYYCNQNGTLNLAPYNANSNPYGLQFECYQDYTGAQDSVNRNETNNLFFSEWGLSSTDWSLLHQNLHAILTQELTNADNCGPGNVFNAVTPLNWKSITS